MDQPLLHVFQFQIAFQCRVIIQAANSFNRGFEAGDPTGAFAAAQALLTAAANISKACWGPKGKRAAERIALRDSIGIADDSAMRDVDMRNNWDHFDERLERWWRDSKDHTYIDMNMGFIKFPSDEETEPINVFRSIDPMTLNISFWGHVFNLNAIIGEARRLLPVVEAAMATWPPRPAPPH